MTYGEYENYVTPHEEQTKVKRNIVPLETIAVRDKREITQKSILD